MKEISEKEINEINTYFFTIYDKKNKGVIKIDNKENIFLHDSLLNSLYYLGIKMKSYQIDELIKKNNFNKEGIIYFEEFIEIIKNKLNDTISNEDIKKYFNLISNEKNFIYKDNLIQILNYNHEFDDIHQLMEEINHEDDKIYYHHFIKIFH